jgi:hypothetical protein
MVRDLVAVVMIGMHQVNDVFMCMSMCFDLGMMFRDDLCQFGEVMGDRTGVRGQEHTKRQGDGQQSSQVSRDCPCHSACSFGSGPTCLIPLRELAGNMAKHMLHTSQPNIIKRQKYAKVPLS